MIVMDKTLSIHLMVRDKKFKKKTEKNPQKYVKFEKNKAIENMLKYWVYICLLLLMGKKKDLQKKKMNIYYG